MDRDRGPQPRNAPCVTHMLQVPFCPSFLSRILAPLRSSYRSFLPDRIHIRMVSTKDVPVGTARRVEAQQWGEVGERAGIDGGVLGVLGILGVLGNENERAEN